jgi:predicted double-glycine peptidase
VAAFVAYCPVVANLIQSLALTSKTSKIASLPPAQNAANTQQLSILKVVDYNKVGCFTQRLYKYSCGHISVANLIESQFYSSKDEVQRILKSFFKHDR